MSPTVYRPALNPRRTSNRLRVIGVGLFGRAEGGERRSSGGFAGIRMTVIKRVVRRLRRHQDDSGE
jgi:hypothetical protein